jgi:hypothetical protein
VTLPIIDIAALNSSIISYRLLVIISTLLNKSTVKHGTLAFLNKIYISVVNIIICIMQIDGVHHRLNEVQKFWIP